MATKVLTIMGASASICAGKRNHSTRQPRFFSVVHCFTVSLFHLILPREVPLYGNAAVLFVLVAFLHISGR